MERQRRAPSGRPVALITAGYWLVALAGAWRFGAGQVCQDFSVDTGSFW